MEKRLRDARARAEAQNNVEGTTGNPIIRPVDPPVGQPLLQPADQPGNNHVDQPMDDPVDEPVEGHANQPADEQVDEPGDKAGVEPANEDANGPAKEHGGEPAPVPAADGHADQPIDDSVGQHGSRPMSEPANEGGERPQPEVETDLEKLSEEAARKLQAQLNAEDAQRNKVKTPRQLEAEHAAQIQREANLARLPQLSVTHGDTNVILAQTDVRGDGNCLFRAFAVAYYGRERYWGEVRRRTRDWYDAIVDRTSRHTPARREMYGYMNALRGTSSSNPTSPIRERVTNNLNDQIHRQRAFGELEMIQVLADIFDVEIIVHFANANANDVSWGLSSRGNERELRENQTTRRQIHLIQYPALVHYTAGNLQGQRFRLHLTRDAGDLQLHRYPVVGMPDYQYNYQIPDNLRRGASLDSVDAPFAQSSSSTQRTVNNTSQNESVNQNRSPQVATSNSPGPSAPPQTSAPSPHNTTGAPRRRSQSKQ